MSHIIPFVGDLVVGDLVSVVQHSAQFFWYLVAVVSTSVGRDCWQRKRQSLWNPLAFVFNVASDERASVSLGQLRTRSSVHLP